MRQSVSPRRTVWVFDPSVAGAAWPEAMRRASSDERTPGTTFSRSPICSSLSAEIPLAAAIAAAVVP